jgi:hypothetical protein
VTVLHSPLVVLKCWLMMLPAQLLLEVAPLLLEAVLLQVVAPPQVAVPEGAPVQVQEALLPGSQVHLLDSQGLPDSSCLLDWLHSSRTSSLSPPKPMLQADCTA